MWKILPLCIMTTTILHCCTSLVGWTSSITHTQYLFLVKVVLLDCESMSMIVDCAPVFSLWDCVHAMCSKCEDERHNRCQACSKRSSKNVQLLEHTVTKVPHFAQQCFVLVNDWRYWSDSCEIPLACHSWDRTFVTCGFNVWLRASSVPVCLCSGWLCWCMRHMLTAVEICLEMDVRAALHAKSLFYSAFSWNFKVQFGPI